ncbi:MAG: CPBP family intramembrane glutamic endopeptidase [Kangiellaceae bacterium]
MKDLKPLIIKDVRIMKLSSKQQSLLEILVVLTVMLLVKDIADRFNTIGAGGIAMWSGILVATFFMKKKKITWKERGLSIPVGRKDWLKSLGLTLLAIVSVIVLMALVVPLVSSLFGVSVPASASERFEFFLGKPLIFAAYLLVVIWVGAALGEELLMRGFLLNTLIAIFGDEKKGMVAAVVLHSIIFGMLHISQGVPGIIGTGLVAILFGVIYLYNDRKLFPLIMAHGIFNSLGLFAYYLSDGNIT